MIERIYIPTYRRPDAQLTWNALPPSWREKTYLVVDREDEEVLNKKGFQTLYCPVQGPPPPGGELRKHAMSGTRQWIAEHGEGVKYAVFDDDIVDFVHTRRPSEPDSQDLVNRIYNGEEEEFAKSFGLMSEWLDEYCTAAFEVTWNPPLDSDSHICFRQTVNHFYNGKTFPLDKIDYTYLECAQDYYVLLQLLTNGYQNRVSLRYRIRPALTQAKGGCEAYRTIEKHNNAMEKLQAAYPDFVSLRTKEVKNGAWKGTPKHAANIQWKKAYKSSQKEETASLEDFFS